MNSEPVWNPAWDPVAAFNPRYRQLWEADPATWAPILDIHAQERHYTAGGGAVAPEPPLPPIGERLANYARAKAAHVLRGSPEVDDATFAQRVAICETCDRFRPSDRKCSSCGCGVDSGIDHKARWADQRCPLTPPLWDVVVPITT